MPTKITRQKTSGFTIVELLIVIVVIGILAAITIVAYNGIQNRANDVAVRSDMSNFHKRMEMQRTVNSRYPATTGLTGIGIKVSINSYDLSVNNLLYCVSNDGTEYGLAAVSKSGKAYFVNYDGSIADYPYSWSGASSSTCDDVLSPTGYGSSTTPNYTAAWGRTGSTGWTTAL